MDINIDHIIDYKNVMLLKCDKRQIILSHTASSIEDFMIKIKNRYNGKYDKVPTYIISLGGVVYEMFKPQYYTKFMGDPSIDKHSISIMLENRGWLYYNENDGYYYDWKSHKFLEAGVVEKEWRGKKCWSPYSDIQYDKLTNLIEELCSTFNIEKAFVGDNTLIEKPKKFRGIISRCNYIKSYYDLSPAFDFTKLNESINRLNIKN